MKMAAFLWVVTCVLLFLQIKESECCDYAFSNLERVIIVDWSTNVDTVVYTVEISLLSELATPDVLLEMSSTSTNFQLNASNTHQILVRECLAFGTVHTLTFSIPSDGTCSPASLAIAASSATPIYDLESTEIITTVDMSDIFDPFPFAFRINITNDAFYGGCGDFACTTLHLNGGSVQLLYDTYEYYFTARKSDIVFGFTYNVEIKCLDNNDQDFVTEGHTIVVNVTFVELTTPGTPLSTTVQATSFLTPSVAPTTDSATSTDLSTTPRTTTTVQPTTTSSLITTSSTTPVTTNSLQQTPTTVPFTPQMITSTSAIITILSTTSGSTTIQKSTNSNTPNAEIVTSLNSEASTINSSPLTTLISSSSGGTGISSMVTTAFLFSAQTSTQSNQTTTTSSSLVIQIPNSENDENFFSSTRNMVLVISGSALVFLGLVLLGLYYIYRKTKKTKKEQKVKPVLLTYSDA